MIQDSAQIRRRGAQDFKAYYEYACARQDSIPLPAVKMNLAKGILDFDGDKVKLTDWPPILSSISINKELHHIAISSTYQAGLAAGDTDMKYCKSTYRKRIPAVRSKDMTLKLCKALRECLSVSPSLKTLQLSGLPLRERDLITLTKGLAKSVSLENLSLANCPIADEGLEAICQSVKYSASIKSVDFSGCNLTWRGAEHMANIIKHQGMRRHGAAWAESLRYRRPEFEGMGGLRRVTLNCNTLIGDRGAAALAHELAEDLWVKAVDLQKCGMSNEGARSLLEALKTNSCLCVLDLRSNPLVDKVLVKTIIEKVLMNADGQSSQYYWIKPPALREPQKPAGPKRRSLATTVRGKSMFRIAPRRGTSAGRRSPGVAQQQRPRPNSKHIPWRTAARAGRQRGLPPGVTVREQSFQGAATVKVTMESDSEEEEEEEEVVVVVEAEKSPSAISVRDRITGRQFQRMQMELEECRLRLGEERRARLKAESRLMEYESENARLHSLNRSLTEALAAPASAASSALEDEAVLESIESSFNKFHAFLDLLKDAGMFHTGRATRQAPCFLLVVVEAEKSPSAISVRDRITGRQFQRMQMELEECRLRLGEERRARLKAESRLMEYESENARLHSLNRSLTEALAAPASAASSALEDEAVLESIESSFNKFHAFLDLLKDAGLGQLASLAGIDQSDFSPLGRPQLSSTIGQPLGGAGSVTGSREGHQDIGAKIGVASSVGEPLPAPSAAQADRLAPRPPGSPRAFLLEDRPQVASLEEDKPDEVALSQASVAPRDPQMDLEGAGEEPDQYSKPEERHRQSGSERSVRSHRSHGDSSHGHKSSHASGSRGDFSQPLQHSNGNSHHSNGSHGYSFNYSNVYSSIHSNGSRSIGSRGDLSVRSSLSDIMSDKAESLGSSGSKSRGRGRGLAAGHSGSEEWEVKPYPGLEALEQIRSLSSLGGQSDDGSF